MPRTSGTMVGLRRGIEILELLATHREGLPFNMILDRFEDLAPSTLSRLLKTMSEEKLVINDAGSRLYSLAARAQILANAICGRAPFAERIQPFVNRLARVTKFSAVFVEVQNNQILLVAKCEQEEAFHYSPVGSKLQYWAEHGLAKICFAHMPKQAWQQHLADPPRPLPKPRRSIQKELREIASCTVLINRHDDQQGLTRIGAPVFADKQFIGAIGISFYRQLNEALLNETATIVEEIGRDASEALL